MVALNGFQTDVAKKAIDIAIRSIGSAIQQHGAKVIDEALTELDQLKVLLSALTPTATEESYGEPH